ncbi:MAG: hypothetical protein ACO3F2_10845 [Roseiflexaceae bacterium]
MWIIFVIMVAGVAFLLGGSYINRPSAQFIERKRHAYLHARAIYTAYPHNPNYRALVECIGHEYIAVEDPVVFNEQDLIHDIHIASTEKDKYL